MVYADILHFEPYFFIQIISLDKSIHVFKSSATYLHSDIVFIFCIAIEKTIKLFKEVIHFILYATVSPLNQTNFKRNT